MEVAALLVLQLNENIINFCCNQDNETGLL